MSNLSTNEIMFDCQVDIANGYIDIKTAGKVLDYIDKYRRYNGDEEKAQENYSSDNWESVFQWAKLFQDKAFMDLLPVSGHHSKNPFDRVYFFKMKYPLLGLIVTPIVYLDVLFAATKPYKLNQGTKKWERDTSGKLKAFFKMKASKMKILKKITDFFIGLSDYYKSWDNVFQIYHGTEHRVYLALKKAEDI